MDSLTHSFVFLGEQCVRMEEVTRSYRSAALRSVEGIVGQKIDETGKGKAGLALML